MSRAFSYVRAVSALSFLFPGHLRSGPTSLRQTNCDRLLAAGNLLARAAALKLAALHLVHRPLHLPAARLTVSACHIDLLLTGQRVPNDLLALSVNGAVAGQSGWGARRTAAPHEAGLFSATVFAPAR